MIPYICEYYTIDSYDRRLVTAYLCKQFRRLGDGQKRDCILITRFTWPNRAARRQD